MITEQKIRAVVERFYQQVRQDAELGPVFNDAIEDWDHHLETLTNFWHSVMLTSGRYQGNPMQAHFKHVGRVTPEMFKRWLGLWAKTAEELLDPVSAANMVSRAQRIATSLQLGLFHRAA